MLKYQWQKYTISDSKMFEFLKNIVNEVKPQIGAVDTETSGLHIMNDKPFVVQFGFLDLKNMRGYSFAVDLESCPIAEDVLSYWDTVAPKLTYYMGHNVKFDLHMLANINHEYTTRNLTDTTFWIRYGHDALHPQEGGPLMGLKEYATKYIDRNAKLHEKQLDREKTEIVKNYNNRLKTMLNTSGAKPPEGFNSFTIKAIDTMFKDCIFEIDDLPSDIKEVYLQWRQSLPLYLQHKVTALVERGMIRYNDLNRQTLLKYAHFDIVYTLEIWASLYEIVRNRKQMPAIKLENACILPWYEMERTGFHADKEYLETCRKNLKAYIIKQRQRLYKIADKEVSVNQHAAIKEILTEKFGIESVSSTGSEALDMLKNKIDSDEAKTFVNLVQELRTLEKWYSTYILRFQKDLQFNDKLYANINPVGTVSGRVTSDFQQFPKKGIKDEEGNEIFHPRRVIYTNTGLVYLDYSQIELRFQALYTYLLKNPDYNMCRAYMPYDCYRMDNEEKINFDPDTPDHIKNYKKYVWYHNEDDIEWKPVDVHGATTKAAFPHVKETDPEFHDLRYIGKRVNFAKNYGAELSRIKAMFPDMTLEEQTRINDAYYKAFPGVKKYHEYCIERAAYYSHTTNLFGVNYYNVSGHKLKNMLIQGSAAFYLKLKIIQLYDYCKSAGIKSKFQMQIHDELSWEYDPADPPEVFFKFKEIMENWPEARVPIIADMEASNTTWADKVEVETLEELKGILK